MKGRGRQKASIRSSVLSSCKASRRLALTQIHQIMCLQQYLMKRLLTCISETCLSFLFFFEHLSSSQQISVIFYSTTKYTHEIFMPYQLTTEHLYPFTNFSQFLPNLVPSPWHCSSYPLFSIHICFIYLFLLLMSVCLSHSLSYFYVALISLFIMWALFS